MLHSVVSAFEMYIERPRDPEDQIKGSFGVVVTFERCGCVVSLHIEHPFAGDVAVAVCV